MSNPSFINGCPLVLCGPILRRVDPSSVTVWLALKASATVTVQVYSGVTNGQGTGQVQAGSRPTLRLGEYLHVVAVTTSGTALESAVQYFYTITFDNTPYGSERGLFAPNIITVAGGASARERLLYSEDTTKPITFAPLLPSFTTPPVSPTQLRILHGSCRKPHGEGSDVMPTADLLIGSALQDGHAQPHQLLLTGDQIYADDVADPLLAVIHYVIDALELPVERLPDRKGRFIDQRRCAVGRRQELVTKEGSFTSDAAKSHLLTFAEYAAMYLLTWSDVLWPRGVWPDDMPPFEVVFPRERALLKDSYDEMRRGQWTMRTVMYPGVALQLGVFLTERAAVIGFKLGLLGVRRAMANVPTLMMLDDHEVTDDWYLSRHWCENAALPYVEGRSGSALGRRVIQNALLAYTIFQGWGNTPARFALEGEEGRLGRELLEHASAWTGNADAHSTEIARLLGLPTTVPAGAPLHVPGGLAYHYEVTWPSYQLIMLDTRTRRVFDAAPDDPPALLTDNSSLAEMLIEVPPPDPEAVIVVVSPAPIFGVPIVVRTAKPMLAALGRARYDYEEWELHAHAFQKLLGYLLAPPAGSELPRRRVITLGGDIHFGYAARVRYSATAPFQRPGGAAEGVLAQLTASAFKNQDWKTTALHGMGYVPAWDQLPAEHVIGWANAGGSRMVIGEWQVPSANGTRWAPWPVEGSPAMEHLGTDRNLTASPDWRYTVSFLKHRDDDPELPPRPSPGAPRPIPDFDPSLDRKEALGRYQVASLNHRDYLGPWGSGKEIVGVNNLAELTFTWGVGDDKKVSQILWWRLEGMNSAAPLTRHEVDLALGPSLYPAPSIRGRKAS